jgi:hypothetical protein
MEKSVTILFHGPDFVSSRITTPFAEKLKNLFQVSLTPVTLTRVMMADLTHVREGR